MIHQGLGDEGDWYHVRYNGVEGYISKQYTEIMEKQDVPTSYRDYIVNK